MNRMQDLVLDPEQKESLDSELWGWRYPHLTLAVMPSTTAKVLSQVATRAKLAPEGVPGSPSTGSGGLRIGLETRNTAMPVTTTYAVVQGTIHAENHWFWQHPGIWVGIAAVRAVECDIQLHHHTELIE